MLASRETRLEGTPFLFHTFHPDPPTRGPVKQGGMSVMELHDHDDDDLPDEVVCAALRAAEFGHSIEVTHQHSTGRGRDSFFYTTYS